MIENLTEFFKAIGDETRQRIINLLLHYPVINVNDLSEMLRLPQSKISRHLAILRHSKWVIDKRREKWVYYGLNSAIDTEFLNSLRKIFSHQLQFQNDLREAEKMM